MSTPIYLGKDITTRQKVFLSDEARPSSVYIIGLSGYGKSTLLENMAYHLDLAPIDGDVLGP
jgi:ABC-type cobalamin/Fe3+-siderophores transport system ATPase subunit